jgi:tellurite resistance protein
MVDTSLPADQDCCTEMVIDALAPRAGLLKSKGGWLALQPVPVGLFGCSAALTALSMAWRLAHNLYGTPVWIADALTASAALVFVCVAVGYVARAFVAPGSVWEEFCHPSTGPLFGIIPINLLLLPAVLAPFSPAVGKALWVVGTGASVVIAWLTATRLLAGNRTPFIASPSLIIPAVALLAIPVAMHALRLPPMHGVETFGLGVGLFLTALSFTLTASRLILGPPLPDALDSSAIVLVAPFATAFVIYVAITSQVGEFPKSLHLTMVFLMLVLLPRLRHLARCCPFRVSWWAVGFPLAMACLPALHFARTEPRLNAQITAMLFLAIATTTSAWLTWQTIVGLLYGSLGAIAGRSAPGLLLDDSIADPSI